MNIREEFAKAALQGQLANHLIVEGCLEEGVGAEECVKELARLAVVAADAVIAHLGGAA